MSAKQFISRLRSITSSPAIDDPQQQRRARLLFTILIALLLGNTIYVAVLPFLTANYLTLLLIDLPIYGFYGTFYVWLRRGHVRRASIALCSTLWIYLTIMSVFTGGIRGPGLFTLVLIVPIAAMLLSGQAALLAAMMMGVSAVVQYGVEIALGLPPSIVTVTPLFNVGTVIVVATVFGILARLAAWNMQQGLQQALRSNQALQDSEYRYRTLVENAPDGILLVDLDTFQLLDANSAAEALFHRPAHELREMRWPDLMDREEMACSQEAIMRKFEQVRDRGAVVCEGHFRRADGTCFTGEMRLVYLPAGPFPCIRTSIIDISERKEREAEREREHERLEQIISAIPSSVAITSLEAEGTVLWANDEMAGMLDIPREQLTGRRIQNFYADPQDRAKLLQEITTRGYLHNFEFLARDRRGATFRARISAQALDFRGQRALLGIVENIEESKQAEEILQRAQKLESLGLLAGGIAHDFNNLLSAIMGQSSLAMIRLEPEHPARVNVEKSVLAAERAAGLTQQMLAYSGRGQFTIETVDLNELVRDNMQLFSASISKRITLRSRLTADPLPVEVDPSQMQQVIMNLLLNASQAIGAHSGTIVLESALRRVRHADHAFWRFTGNPLAPGAYAILSIRDNGVGMNQEIIEKIFDPFFTTKKEGSGLGLAAVLGILRGHRGGIRVASKPGAGTTFSILLPLVTTALQAPSASNGAAQIALSPCSTILVIDDEEPITEFIRDALEVIQIKTVMAHNGAAGIERLRQSAEQIGLVILDLSMPGISSVETFHGLRRINPDLRIALTSGYDRREATRDFPSGELAGFIPKPLTAEKLQAQVRELLTAS